MKNLILVLALSIISFHASAGPASLEKIMGYQPGNNSLSFQVHSGGCTQKSDFEIQVVHPENRPAEIYLYRVRKDPCLSFLPTGAHIKFSLEEVGLVHGQAFIVKNANGVVYSWIWSVDDAKEYQR